MGLNQFGVIGLGVMGSNLSQNLLEKNVKISVYDKNTDTSRLFEERYGGNRFEDMEAFVASLSKPRKIIIMVTAGKIVESVIDALVPLLTEGDIIIDGGNSHYRDTVRRYGSLQNKKIHFVGMGISGGAKGARYGASLMPSGNKNAVREIMPYLQKIAAKTVKGDECVDYIGESGSGHFIKMVHNGIEYADIQIICDAYAILKYGMKLTNKEISDIFETWNTSRLNAFLLEITVDILRTKDTLTDADIVDMISDRAGSKGTGKWTVQYAIEEGLPCGTLFSAVDVRNLSRLKTYREPYFHKSEQNLDISIEDIEIAVYASKLIAYMQGFSLMEHASKQFKWNMNFESISRIWGAGCIIQGKLINEIHEVYLQNKNKALSESIKIQSVLESSLPVWEKVVGQSLGVTTHIPVISTALTDYIGCIVPKLSTNLLQAMRDNFGGHTYTRDDREGVFHTEW